MATPVKRSATLGGVLGDILVDVVSIDTSAATPAVLVVHGFKGFKDWGMFPPFADRLARAGFTAVSFNLSGSGVDAAGEFSFPDRFGHNTFSNEIRDVSTVLDALDRGDLGVVKPSSVGVVGHSRGGGTSILCATQHRRVRALVTWAAIATVERWTDSQRQTWRAGGKLDVVNARTGEVLPMYTDVLDDVETNGRSGLNILAAAAAVEVPWLVVHGEADEAVPWGEAEQLVAAAKHAELLKVEGAGHTFGAVHPFAGPTPALDLVFDASVRFLSQHLS